MTVNLRLIFSWFSYAIYFAFGVYAGCFKIDFKRFSKGFYYRRVINTFHYTDKKVSMSFGPVSFNLTSLKGKNV